ncbi:hypothetical protein JPH1_46730 [Mycobacterium avium subsp. hominissuis]|uniref:Uncharacterized protein n=1 Tax=Mycobacterium avium subsp. hominissuis TaxID=439334 RepID=A0AAI8SPD1_MYCAV|nr:hypothetical protein JPH1_46730 [Mycobacterium avium subsp. hominissuis]
MNTSATASTIIAIPPATCIARCRRRNAATRWATRRPASAKASSGSAFPAANVAVNTSAPGPIEEVPPATTIAASTGPAHGTYSAPNVRPRPKPSAPGRLWRCGR